MISQAEFGSTLRGSLGLVLVFAIAGLAHRCHVMHPAHDLRGLVYRIMLGDTPLADAFGDDLDRGRRSLRQWA